ncbi:MAG: hypothetical protein RDU20_08565 [Desulfomonilaceae bacterium]|nr:hypothetical protein [Desulfomonilaceae bacterium]
MAHYIIGTAVIVLIYFCFFIVIFSPTIYAFWIYLVGKKVKLRKKGLFRTALMTLCINVVVAYFLTHLAFDYFLVSKMAEKQALAEQALRSAVVSQKEYFSSHGRYYSVGPVRGPYRDDHGLTVHKDVIVSVEPQWDRHRKKETFQAYALHVWGRDVITATQDGKVVQVPEDSAVSASVRSKLINSTR